MKAMLMAVIGLVGAGSGDTWRQPDPVRRVVDDYVGLYRKDSLEEWKRLFLPSFTSTSANADGSVRTRTLEEFYEAQRRGFAETKETGETLENVRIERSGRLASAWADFVFRSDGTSRRGRLVLTLIEQHGAFRIAGLMFSY
jgi:SnoaL-like domain